MNIKVSRINNPFFTGPRSFVLSVDETISIQNLSTKLLEIIRGIIDEHNFTIEGPLKEGNLSKFIFHLALIPSEVISSNVIVPGLVINQLETKFPWSTKDGLYVVFSNS